MLQWVLWWGVFHWVRYTAWKKAGSVEQSTECSSHAWLNLLCLVGKGKGRYMLVHNHNQGWNLLLISVSLVQLMSSMHIVYSYHKLSNYMPRPNQHGKEGNYTFIVQISTSRIFTCPSYHHMYVVKSHEYWSQKQKEMNIKRILFLTQMLWLKVI